MIVTGKHIERTGAAVDPDVEGLETLIAEGHVAVMESRRRSAKRGLVLPELNIKALRHELGLSQNDFAMRYGIPLTTLQNWEQNRRKPDTISNLLLHFIRDDQDGMAKKVARLRMPSEVESAPAQI